MSTVKFRNRRIVNSASAWVAGLVSAAILAVALVYAGSPVVLLAYVAPIPLFLAGLGLGIVPGITAAIVGAVALYATMPQSFGHFYMISDALPAIGLIVLAMRQRRLQDGRHDRGSEGSLLTALAVYPCLMFLAIYGATMGQDGGLYALTLDAFNSMSDQVNTLLADNGQTVTPEMTLKIHQYFALCARVTPALAMCVWLFSTLIAMVIAQSLLQRQKWNLHPAFTLSHLQVPNWVIFAAAATGLCALYAPGPFDYIGLNLAILLGIPFFFVGLAVVHALAARSTRPTLVLTIFYIVISLIVHLVLLVAILGAVDQWVDFRKRFAGRPSN